MTWGPQLVNVTHMTWCSMAATLHTHAYICSQGHLEKCFLSTVSDVSWTSQNMCWSAYLHELCGLHGMKQTYSQMPVFIVHCYHIKADNFGHSQQDRNNPDQSYFDCRPHWNADAFDSIPGHHSSVSAQINWKTLWLGGLFVCNNDTFFFC